MAKKSTTATAPRPRVTADELRGFVEVFQAAGSITEVVEASGWKIEKVRAQATRLRKAGVPLKKFGKKSALTPEDIGELKALCSACGN